MKHGKAALLLDLAMELQARIEGMTIDEIATFIGASRRTAERYRDELELMFPGLKAETRFDGLKSWKLSSNRFLSKLSPNAEELAQLQSASRLYQNNGQLREADQLDGLYRKIAPAKPGDLPSI